LLFSKKSCLFFFRLSFPKKNKEFLPPHTPFFLKRRARCALLLLLLERDGETQKARGSIVDTSSPPRFDFFFARGVVFFSELCLSTVWEERIGKRHPRAHTNSAAVLENFQ